MEKRSRRSFGLDGREGLSLSSKKKRPVQWGGKYSTIKGNEERTLGGKIQYALSVESVAVDLARGDKSISSAKPIWETVLELGTSIPDEEWSKIPTDLAKNLHYYLYGARKE